MADGDHAAELVAVRDAVDQHVRARLARLEAMHVIYAGISGAVRREVAWQDLEGGSVHAGDCATRGPAVAQWDVAFGCRFSRWSFVVPMKRPQPLGATLAQP